VGRGVPDAADAGDGVDGPEQVGEARLVLAGPEVAPVGVDVLAQQGDLGNAVGGELGDLPDDVAEPAALLLAPDGGTMQKAQVLSQPIWMVTQAAWSTSRRAGRAEGNASLSSRISMTGPSSRERSKRSTA